MKTPHTRHQLAIAPEKSETATASNTPAAVRVVDSRDLFKQDSTVHIDHSGHRYVLRVTRENKLILTK
jgi:hemin uptake protein HemP